MKKEINKKAEPVAKKADVKTDNVVTFEAVARAAIADAEHKAAGVIDAKTRANLLHSVQRYLYTTSDEIGKQAQKTEHAIRSKLVGSDYVLTEDEKKACSDAIEAGRKGEMIKGVRNMPQDARYSVLFHASLYGYLPAEVAGMPAKEALAAVLEATKPDKITCKSRQETTAKAFTPKW